METTEDYGDELREEADRLQKEKKEEWRQRGRGSRSLLASLGRSESAGGVRCPFGREEFSRKGRYLESAHHFALHLHFREELSSRKNFSFTLFARRPFDRGVNCLSRLQSDFGAQRFEILLDSYIKAPRPPSRSCENMLEEIIRGDSSSPPSVTF